MVAVRPTRGLGLSSISRWVTTVASLPAATGVNVCRADGPSSSAGMPVLDPERAGVLVAGRLDSLQPFRHHMGVRSEIQGQDGQFLHIEALQLLPHPATLLLIEFDLHRIDQRIGASVAVAGKVLAGPDRKGVV